jgi:hypothetical protein
MIGRGIDIQGRFHALTGVLVLSLVALLTSAASAWAAPEDFGFASTDASVSMTQAGAHPDLTTLFTLDGDPAKLDVFGQPEPWGTLRNVSTELPAGLTGNPAAFPTCSNEVFFDLLSFRFGGPLTEQCPPDSQVGVVAPGGWNFFQPGELIEPLFNLESPGRDVIARLGFWALGYPAFIDIRVDPERDYAVTASVVNNPTTAFRVTGTKATIWGVPTHPSHDSERFTPEEAFSCGGPCGGPPVPSGLAQTAFMSNPTSCGAGEVGFEAESYAGVNAPSMPAPLGTFAACESVPFEPTMSLTPTSRHTDSPAGVDVSLSLPQDGITDPESLRTSDLKDAKVTLPVGARINAAVADGLEGCSEEEVGLVSGNPIRFDGDEATCPGSSKIGTVTIVTPVLEEPLEGSMYLAEQAQNPFGALLAGYLVAEGKGVIIKQAARFELNGETGQITAIFENAPQQPFTELEMHFKGGIRGVLQTPERCGTYTTTYELTPWSDDAPAVGTSNFEIDQGCNSGGFDPQLSAGARNAVGGIHSPFVIDLSRGDGEQNITSADIVLPEGEIAKLAGVALCPELGAETGSCPEASRIGRVNAAVGTGPLPLWVPQANKAPSAIYLAGPYKGAPYSAVVKVPAQAGPFDLGVVTVRLGIYVDPQTTQVTVRSDALPQLLQGIPVSYRRIHAVIDRPTFALNPTSCDVMSVNAALVSSQGKFAFPTDRFQLSGCGELGFRPRLTLKLKGGTRRGAHPALRAVAKMRRGHANIARAAVTLPRSEFLENSHIRTVCTRVQFAAEACPPGSIYGRARAFTPLLDRALSGPVYLRSSDNTLPDLVADLTGQIHVVVVGRIDSVRGGIRSTFETVPDAPVSRFVLEMQGGEKGLLVNSRNLCSGVNRAIAKFDGHNSEISDSRPVVRDSCTKAQRRRFR